MQTAGVGHHPPTANQIRCVVVPVADSRQSARPLGTGGLRSTMELGGKHGQSRGKDSTERDTPFGGRGPQRVRLGRPATSVTCPFYPQYLP